MTANITNGQTLFDPSKKIKAALGEEYTGNIQAEAIERLSEAMASNGIRKRNDYVDETREEENDMKLRDILRKRTTHTNPSKQTLAMEEENSFARPEEVVAARKNALITSQEKLNGMIDTNKSVINKAVRFTTGFGTKDSSEQNISQLVNCAFRNVSAMAVNDAMETTFKLGNDKYIGISAGISTAVDFGVNTLFSGNKARVNSIFDNSNLTADEISNINKTINKERIKYGAQHALASVVLPAAVKFGIKKATKGKINNKIFDAVTSFGVLSEVGKVSLNMIRRASEQKMISEASKKDFTVSSDKNVSVKAYGDIAKIAVNHTINETLDDTIIGSAIGSYIGYKSVVFKEPETATSKALKAFKDSNVPTFVEPVKVEQKSVAAKTSGTKKIA